MALPIVDIDAGTGNDANASGSGPSTAITGTTGVTSADGLTVVLDGNPDLTNVATDGSHALFMADTNAGSRNFSPITSKANSGTPTAQVGVSLAFQALNTDAWAIGGKRASIGSTTSKKLVDNNGAAGDAGGGWKIRFASAHSETIAATMNVRCSGTTTDGRLTIEGVTGAATLPKLIFSNNGNALVINGSKLMLSNFELQNSSASKGSAQAIENNTAGTGVNNIFKGLKIADSTNKFNKGLVLGIEGNIVRDCYIANHLSHGIDIAAASSLLICNNLIKSNAGSGINLQAQNTGSCRIRNNIIDGNTLSQIASGITGTTSRRSYIKNNIIRGGASGVLISSASTDWSGFASWIIDGNNFINNTDYAIKFTGASVTSEMLYFYALTILCNNHWNCTGGFSNLDLLNIQGEAFDEGTTNLDPALVDPTNLNYAQGVNAKAKGYPEGLLLPVGTVGPTRNYWDPGIQRLEGS